MFDLTFLRICLKQNAFFGLFKRIYWKETQKKIVFAFNTDKFSEENIISNFWKQNFVKFADFMDLDSYLISACFWKSQKRAKSLHLTVDEGEGILLYSQPKGVKQKYLLYISSIGSVYINIFFFFFF